MRTFQRGYKKNSFDKQQQEKAEKFRLEQAEKLRQQVIARNVNEAIDRYNALLAKAA